MATTIVCWNIGGRRKPWNELLEMDADIGMLQEVRTVPPIGPPVEVRPGGLSDPWGKDSSYTRWPLVVKLSDRVQVEWFKPILPVKAAGSDEMVVTGMGRSQPPGSFHLTRTHL